MDAIKVGILGLGTVGTGVFQVLLRNQAEIAARAGRAIEVVAVCDRNLAQADKLTRGKVQIVSDAHALVRDPEIAIIVELIGGTEPAKTLILEAIAHKKQVVTANKALIALHGNEIFHQAQKQGVMVAFEAAVAGGIPIIKALREGLTANKIQKIVGIVNGTSNFILSAMRDQKVDFHRALQEAQRLGYAEADPQFDIAGIDAAHKMAILSAIAFGIPIQFDAVHIEGIADLDIQDIQYAEQLGYRIKLLGITKRHAADAGIELRVHPALVPVHCLLASVDGAMNAVWIHGDAIGETLYYGKGAGAEPTASAVIADLVDVTRLATADFEHRVPHLAFQPERLQNLPMMPMEAVNTRFYLRIGVTDQPGVMANITAILSQAEISIETMFQKSLHNKQVHIVLLTHPARESNITMALQKIAQLPAVTDPVTRLRCEIL